MVHALESTTQSCQCKTLLKQPKTKKTVSEFNQDNLSSPCCSAAWLPHNRMKKTEKSWCWFKLFGLDTPHVIPLISFFFLFFFNLLYLWCSSFPVSFTCRVVHQFSFSNTLECLTGSITPNFLVHHNLAIKRNSGPSLCSLQLRRNWASKPQSFHPGKALSFQSNQQKCTVASDCCLIGY